MFSQILGQIPCSWTGSPSSTEVAAHVTKVDYKDDVRDWGHQDAMMLKI